MGFGLATGGLMVRAHASQLENIFDDATDVVANEAQAAAGKDAPISKTGISALLNDLVGGFGSICIGVGFLMLLIGINGLGGACCMVKYMIIGVSSTFFLKHNTIYTPIRLHTPYIHRKQPCLPHCAQLH